MAAKNAVAKSWSVAPSSDGKRWSAWPAGDKPAGGGGDFSQDAADAAQDAAWDATFAAMSATSTKYLAPSGGSNANPGTEAQPYATLAYALSQISAGGHIIVLDGTITVGTGGWLNDVTGGVTIPSGVSWDQPTVLRAKNRFGVTLSQASALWDGYVIRLDGCSNVHVDGFLCVVSGEPNNHIDVGSNNSISRTMVRSGSLDEYGSIVNYGSGSVVEEVFVYGATRYSINTGTGGSSTPLSQGVVRRCITYGAFGRTTQPKAGFSVYGSNDGAYAEVKDIAHINCFDIDSGGFYTNDTATYWGSFYTPKSVRNIEYVGCGSINVRATHGGTRSDNIGTSTATGHVCVDTFVVGLQGSSGTPDAFGNSFGGGTYQNYATNCLAQGNVGGTFGEAYSGRQTSCRTSGATYPTVRVSGTGSEVLYQIGNLRQKWGTSGYKAASSRRLWPFPYERDIASFFGTAITKPSGWVGDSATTNPFGTYSVTERVFRSLGSSMPDLSTVY